LHRLDQIGIVSWDNRIIVVLKRQKHRDQTSSVARLDLVDVAIGEHYFQFALRLRDVGIKTFEVVQANLRLRRSLPRVVGGGGVTADALFGLAAKLLISKPDRIVTTDNFGNNVARPTALALRRA
jgi:hypothetical protein